jgi:hypothetical protein
MQTVIHDRIFWIYFIVTLFFIIIGVGAIVTSNDPYLIIISILWLISNVTLMILVYHASVRWAPVDTDDVQICVVDSNSGCFDPDNRVWLFVNIIFILLLIISVSWAVELGNPDGGPLKTLSGVLILLGGIVLCAFATGKLNYRECRPLLGNLDPKKTGLSTIYTIPFWVAIGYLVIWLGLTLYVVLGY